MPNLTGSISFTAAFDFTGTPAVILTPTSTIPLIDKPNLIGHFVVTQPDGIAMTGTSGQVVWGGTSYNNITVPLTLASDYTYQKGTYTITFFATCTGYVYGDFTRTWDMEYIPVSLTLTDGFDCYKPELKYTDSTNYGVGGYSITAVTSSWVATSTAGNPTGSSSVFDLVISGNYYDSTYVIVFVKTVNYLHANYSWLTVNQRLTKTVTKKAIIPPSMAALLTYLVAVKDQRDLLAANCQSYADLDAIFTEANGLYQLMRSRVCAQNTNGLSTTFDEFYQLTHNYQNFIYTNTNGMIPAYDFTTGCVGSGATTQTYTMRSPIGVSSFTVSILSGKTLIAATRSGLVKGITSTATADTEFIQVSGTTVTLPTGDITNTVTLPDSSQVGELFSFTYN